nr:MAG TPA: hypothetical protein [Caudoviricetes sp.]
MAYDSFIINSAYKQRSFTMAGFDTLSSLNTMLSNVRLERRKHTELLLNTTTTMPVALNGMANKEYVLDDKAYIFDIETLPSIKVGNEQIPDIMWQYTARREGETYNMFSGIDEKAETAYRNLFLKPDFKYEELSRSEKVVADTLARIGKNYREGSGSIPEALSPLGYKDYADMKKYQELIENGINALSKEGDATHLIAKEIVDHIHKDTTLVTYNGKAFDVNMTSQQIARDTGIDKKVRGLAINKLSKANHYDPYREIRTAYQLNPQSMKEAYREHILGSDIAKERLIGEFTGWSNKQTSFGLAVGLDVNAAHSAIEDTGVFENLMKNAGFRAFMAKAIEINNSPKNKVQYKVSAGATIFNTSSLWNRDRGILMFQQSEDGGYEFPQFSARANDNGVFTAYNNAPIVTNSAYNVKFVGQLDRNDSSLGAFAYEHANELGLKGNDDIHYIALEEASGRGPVRYIMGSKKVLEDTLTDSFRVLSNTSANGETTYNFEQIVSAANSLGIPMGRPDNTMDKVIAASAKRQSSANAWDKIESGAFNREAYVTGPLIKNFAENERGMALNILGDALELGTDVATAASARKAGDTGGIITDDFMKRTEQLFGIAKQHYGIDSNDPKSKMFSVAGVQKIIENINNEDVLSMVNMVQTEAAALPGVKDYHKTVAMNLLAKEYHKVYDELHPEYGYRASISDKMLDGISKDMHLSGGAFSFDVRQENAEKSIGSIKNTMKRLLTRPGRESVSRSDYVKGYSVLVKNIFGAKSRQAQGFENLVERQGSDMTDFAEYIFRNVQQLRIDTYRDGKKHHEMFRTSSTPSKDVSLFKDDDELVNRLRASVIKNLKALSSTPEDSVNSIYNYLMGNITRKDFDIFSNRNNYAGALYDQVSDHMKSFANQLEFLAHQNQQDILIKDGRLMMGKGNTFRDITGNIPLLKRLDSVPVLAFGNTNIAINPILNVVEGAKPNEKFVQIGIKGLSTYDHLENSVKYTLENNKNLGQMSPVEALFETLSRLKKDLNITYSKEPIEGKTPALLQGYGGVLDSSFQLDTSGIKEDFKFLYQSGYLTDEHIKASGIASDWNHINFQDNESLQNEFIKKYIYKDYSGKGSVFNVEKGEAYRGIESRRALESLIFAKDSSGMTPIENALQNVNSAGKFHELQRIGKDEYKLRRIDRSGTEFAQSIELIPEVATQKNAVHNTMPIAGIKDNASGPNINFRARNDTARSYNKSMANATMLTPEDVKDVLRQADLPDNYEENHNILNYKYNETGGKYVFNGTNVVINGRLEEGQTVAGEKEKIFNIMKKKIEKTYNRKMTQEEIDHLKSMIDLNTFDSLNEGSALIRTGVMDALATSNTSPGGTSFNLTEQSLNKEFLEENMPIYRDVDGTLRYKDSQKMTSIGRNKKFNVFAESNAYGDLPKISRTEMFGKINFYSDHGTRKLTKEEVQDILDKIGTVDASYDYETLVRTLKTNGVTVMMDYKPVGSQATKLFAESDKLTAASLNTRVGQYDKKLASIFKKAGFGKAMEKQLNWEFLSNMILWHDKLADVFETKDNKPDIVKLRGELSRHYGSLEAGVKAIRKERDLMDKALGEYLGVEHWSTATGATEAAKRKDVFRLTNRVLNDLIEGLDESNRGEVLSRVAKTLKEKGTFKFIDDSNLEYNLKNGKVEFSDYLKDIGTYENETGKIVSKNWDHVINDIKSALKEDEIKKIDKDYLNEKNKYEERISYLQFSKNYVHQAQVATLDSVSAEQLKRLMLNSKSVEDAALLFDKNSKYYTHIAERGGMITVGDDILDAFTHTRYSRLKRKEEQKLAHSNSFEPGSLEDIINKEYASKNIIASEDHIKEVASYEQQLALAKRNGVSNSGSQATAMDEFDRILKSKDGNVQKAALNELNNKINIADIKFDDKGNIINVGHLRGNISVEDGKYHFNYDLHLGRTYGNQQLSDAQTAYVNQTEEMLHYINAGDYEKARLAQNKLADAKQRVNDATSDALKLNSDLTKSVKAITAGYRISSESMRVDDASDFIQSRKYINGMTVADLQKRDYTPAVAIVGQERLEQLGLLDSSLSEAEKATRLKQIREEGVTIMLDRQPHNYAKSMAFAKVYYDPSIADNAIRTNTAFNMLAKADHDGDKVYLTKVLENKMSNGTPITANDMLAADMQYRRDVLDVTPKNIANEAADRLKTYMPKDVEFEQGTIADNIVRNRLTTAAGEPYNAIKGLERMVGDLKINEEVTLSGGKGISKTTNAKQLVAEVASGMHETFLSPKNFSQEFVSKITSLPSAIQDALQYQKGDTAGSIIRRVSDTLTSDDEIWNESFGSMKKNTTLYKNMVSDIIENEGLTSDAAEAKAAGIVREQFQKTMENVAQAADEKGWTSGQAVRELRMFDARALRSDSDVQIKQVQEQQKAMEAAQEATKNAPMNQVEQKVTDMQTNEAVMNKGLEERVSKLRNSAFKKLDKVKSNRSKAVLGALAVAAGSVLVAGYGSQSPVPDVDNTASQNMGQANTSARLVIPQKGQANGGYIINVATSTNQDPQAAIAALNNAPAFAGGGSATVTTRVTSQYEDMNANDIANYLDSVF